MQPQGLGLGRSTASYELEDPEVVFFPDLFACNFRPIKLVENTKMNKMIATPNKSRKGCISKSELNFLALLSSTLILW